MSTIIVSAAVLWHQGKVLLTRRMSGAHLAGMWEFPGGKVEEGESPQEALARECLEECGVEVAVDDILDVAFHRYPDKDVLLLFYMCRWLGGELRDLGVAEHVWCEPHEIGSYALPPPDDKVVAKIQELSR